MYPNCSFAYLEEIDNKSYNRNFLVRRSLIGSQWVGKISYSLKEKGVNFIDLNDRAILANRLLKLLDFPVLPHKVVPVTEIKNLDLAETNKERIDNQVFLTKFGGINLSGWCSKNEPDLIRLWLQNHRSSILNNFVFNLWIGNYDRKDSDYLINEKRGRIYFIDYQLWGPGFQRDKSLALGAYAESYSIDDPTDTGWCAGGLVMLDFLKKQFLSFNDFSLIISPIIKKIVNLSCYRIAEAMCGLTFFDETGTKKINDSVCEFLIFRKNLLREAIAEWFLAGCVKSGRPKDLTKEDNIYQ